MHTGGMQVLPWVTANSFFCKATIGCQLFSWYYQKSTVLRPSGQVLFKKTCNNYRFTIVGVQHKRDTPQSPECHAVCIWMRQTVKAGRCFSGYSQYSFRSCRAVITFRTPCQSLRTKRQMLVMPMPLLAFTLFVLLSVTIAPLLTFCLSTVVLPMPAWFRCSPAIQASSPSTFTPLLILPSHTGVLATPQEQAAVCLHVQQTLRQMRHIYLEHRFCWKIFGEKTILKQTI